MGEKILIADPFHPLLLLQLDKENIPYLYLPGINREEIKSLLAGNIRGLVIRSKTPADKDLLETAPSLKFIIRGGAGMDNIDEAYASEKGIRCYNAGAANSIAVAEHALGMMLNLFNKICQANSEVKKGHWDREAFRGMELMGRTVGIIGYGNTGSATGKLFAALGAEVLAYDKYKTGFGTEEIREVQMEEIYARAEILSLHIPLTAETTNLLDTDYIYRFKRPFFLMNLSRGGIVCLENVNTALDEGHLRGFCADVLENENFKTLSEKQRATFESLSRKAHVIFTPHVAGWTEESYKRIAEVVSGIIKTENERK